MLDNFRKRLQINLGNAADSNDSEWSFYTSKHFVLRALAVKAGQGVK